MNNITEEHVFPQWLQKTYNLHNQFVVLKNGTKFKYGRLKVPCCPTCNNEDLSIIENNISKAIKEEDIEYLNENSDNTFIWLYKIMYGLQYKEMFLKENLKYPTSSNIISQKEFFEKTAYNIFPLYAIGKVRFEGFSPYSLFVFKLSEKINGEYFYADEPYKMFSSIVLGNIGIVCSFQCDGNLKKDINNNINIDKFKTLSLAEFADFCSFVLHLKCRLKPLPDYVCTKEPEGIVFKIQEKKDMDIYSEFDEKLQYKFSKEIYGRFFEKLIITNDEGEKVMRYKSPFTYF